MNSHRHLFEWTMAGALLVMGLHVLALPGSLIESRVAPVLSFLPEWAFAIFCLIAGTSKIVGLYFENRLKRWSYILRAGGATFGLAMLMQLYVALILSAGELRLTVSPLIWIYWAFAVGEILVIKQVRRDADS